MDSLFSKELKNCFVPERAMVPMLSITSSFDIPIPLSEIVRVFSFSFELILIDNSSFASNNVSLVSDSNLSRSARSNRDGTPKNQGKLDLQAGVGGRGC